MATQIRLSSTLSLPIDAVTQTFACIGRKGAGKTYLANLLAEQMLDIGAQVIVLDPVGNWWGLRVAADGKGKGKDIFIAGGERGDVPVLPEAGARFARLVVEKNISMILDVSSFRQGERKRFAADFAEEFFHLKKKQRSAVHLLVEEAQLFVPQRPGPEEARMLGAYENIIRLGRNYGIGATLISQRPQSVNKEVLSQVECLCVLQVNGTHERKALEEWVQEAGADRKLVGELPGLSRGEGYVWSPSWLRIFQKVRFGVKTTFDASSTPEVGRAAKAATLSAVDVEALRSDLKEVVAQVERDDPKVLRRKIAELEREAQRAKAAVPQPDPAVVNSLKSRIKELESHAQASAKQLDGYRVAFEQIGKISAKMMPPLLLAPKMPEEELSKIDFGLPSKIIAVQKPQMDTRIRFEPLRVKPASANGSSSALKAGARRMLAVLCRWHPAGMTEAQVAAQVQMKRTSGTWRNYKGSLKAPGLLEERNGLWFATDAGLNLVGNAAGDTPASTEEVIELWKPKLKKGAREMLDAILANRNSSMTREELGAAVGMEQSGTFRNYLGSLKQAGLILVDHSGVRANAETLML